MGRFGYGKRYGDNRRGYGDPLWGHGLTITSPSGTPPTVPDDGGVHLVIRGTFQPEVPHRVRIGGLAAYPVPTGQGFSCYPDEAGETLSCVVPGGLALGQAAVEVFWPGGHVVLDEQLTVVHRYRPSAFWALNRLASTARAHRARGPVAAVGDSVAGLFGLYRPRRGLLEAVAYSLTRIFGFRVTHLAAPLAPAPVGTVPPPDALTAQVESTYGVPDEGEVVVEGERIPFTGRTAGALTGLTRDDAVRSAYPAGTPVTLYTRDVSGVELARRMLLVDHAEGAFLDALGRNYGVPRYLSLRDEDYRRLIRALAYQAGRGTRTALNEALEILLAGRGLAGADGVVTAGAVPTLTSVAAPFTSRMVDLRVRIAGATAKNARTCKIVAVPDASTLVLDRKGSPWWSPADLANEAEASWEILPFDLFETPTKPCTVVVRLNSAPPTSARGFAYLQGGCRVTSTDALHVTVPAAIRQVLGVWLATDPRRVGTNYATTNQFAGQTILLDEALPAAETPVLVDYGAVNAPTDPPVSGIPGAAGPPATAQLLAGVAVSGMGVPLRYPLYLGDRVGAIYAILRLLTVAGVIPELYVHTW